MATISPGTFTDNGLVIPVQGGPWTIGQAPEVRAAQAVLFSVVTQASWNGTKWVTVTPS